MLKKRQKDGRRPLNLSPWSKCVLVCVSASLCLSVGIRMCDFNVCEPSHIPLISVSVLPKAGLPACTWQPVAALRSDPATLRVSGGFMAAGRAFPVSFFYCVPSSQSTRSICRVGAQLQRSRLLILGWQAASQQNTKR